MLKQDIEIINKLGLHARASSKLTQTASQFSSEIWIEKNGRKVLVAPPGAPPMTPEVVKSLLADFP